MAAFAQIELVGRKMLCEGATAIDTVEHVVVLLEDCVYFNAGKGSVFTHTGTHEMDACIMDGTTMITGACCNVHNIRNPVKLARVVAEETQHCLLCGLGAEALAAKHNILSEDNVLLHRGAIPAAPGCAEKRRSGARSRRQHPQARAFLRC